MSEKQTQPNPITILQQERREISEQMQNTANSDTPEWGNLFNRVRQVDKEISCLESQVTPTSPTNPTGEWTRKHSHPADKDTKILRKR